MILKNTNLLEKLKYMWVLFFLMIIIPIVGELHLNIKLKKILLLIISFLYNTLLGLAMWFSILVIASLTVFLNLYAVSMIIIGISFLMFLIPINMYVKRKVKINIVVYIILNVIGFLIGFCLLWRG